VFGGHKTFKAVLQLMACALGCKKDHTHSHNAGERDCVYFTFGDEALVRELSNIHTLFHARGFFVFMCFVLTFGAITVGAAYKLLLQFQAFLVRNRTASLSGASALSVPVLMSQHFFIRPLENKSHKK
jgi:hypothetical protein